jgi:hypothetical protein
MDGRATALRVMGSLYQRGSWDGKTQFKIGLGNRSRRIKTFRGGTSGEQHNADTLGKRQQLKTGEEETAVLSRVHGLIINQGNVLRMRFLFSPKNSILLL